MQGLGFVTGLDGTGTKALAPGIRQQILDIMRRNKVEHPEEIVESPDTAVVMVSGRLAPGIGQGELFDLEVRAIPSTEATSLEGGFLLECDLTRVVVDPRHRGQERDPGGGPGADLRVSVCGRREVQGGQRPARRPGPGRRQGL